MKTIPLTQGRTAVIDDADFDLVSQFKWHAHFDGTNWYALRRTATGHQSMHNLVMGSPTGVKIDHRDHNGLNNRRGNLRVCEHRQNCYNLKMKVTNRSGYKGVSWKTTHQRWCAQIRFGKVYHLGLFEDKIDAARAYDSAAVRYFGEFAATNQSLGLL
jgi:hypothetical protein